MMIWIAALVFAGFVAEVFAQKREIGLLKNRLADARHARDAHLRVSRHLQERVNDLKRCQDVDREYIDQLKHSSTCPECQERGAATSWFEDIKPTIVKHTN